MSRRKATSGPQGPRPQVARPAAACLSRRIQEAPTVAHKAVSTQSEAFRPSRGGGVPPHGSMRRPREPRAHPQRGDHVGISRPDSWPWDPGCSCTPSATSLREPTLPPLLPGTPQAGPVSICPAAPGRLEIRAEDRRELMGLPSAVGCVCLLSPPCPSRPEPPRRALTHRAGFSLWGAKAGPSSGLRGVEGSGGYFSADSVTSACGQPRGALRAASF